MKTENLEKTKAIVTTYITVQVKETHVPIGYGPSIQDECVPNCTRNEESHVYLHCLIYERSVPRGTARYFT